VCGIWYGKSPGVDRSTDAFRHGNAAGSAKNGGVLVVAGDDHGCKSSSSPGQSEFAFVDMHMPVLNPSSVQEVLDYGLYGFELSRYSGCWVAMITLSENMDSSATVEIDSDRVKIVYPTDVEMPPGGLNIRIPDSPLEQEERLWRYKRPAAIAFSRKNNLNKVVLDNPEAKLGIISAGKAHLDLIQALDDLDIDQDKAKELGISILKVGMTYPLDVTTIRDFARGLDYLFVVEEKRSLMEVQLKEELYNIEVVDSSFPKIIGKLDSQGKALLPSYGELSPSIIADVLIKALPNNYRDEKIVARLSDINSSKELATTNCINTQRTPFFCSGCPHNTSTKVPDGSRALAGIGCHYLVQTMERDTYTFTQMGGEGVSWVGQHHFTETDHVFVNLGDGTYFHSGVLAIRASVAAKVNITYKILYNETVAMTGGQPHDGELRPDMIATQVLAEGVTRLVLVMDDVTKYQGKLNFPSQVQVRHRDDLDEVQCELREVKGVTCILYDQTCATELRRKRKRGLVTDPKHRAVINELVCESCGDCSVQSNCIAVEPKETDMGVKRQVNQDNCNKDLSCVKGFCPSFVSVIGGDLRRPKALTTDFIAQGEALPLPKTSSLNTPWSVLVTGIGGTGVVTVGALMAMAAYLEGKAVTTLDQTGLAQKGGAVYTHIRIANSNEQLHAVRISDSCANALIACDLVAASAISTCISKLNANKTIAVINTDVTPTSAFALGKDTTNETQAMIELIASKSLTIRQTDAYCTIKKCLGNTVTANIFMLGYAYQMGCVPIGLEALYQAIELNGVAIEANKKAFNIGRIAADNQDNLEVLLGKEMENKLSVQGDLATLISNREAFLTDYQNAAYAKKYRELVEKVIDKERQVDKESNLLAMTVARYAFKLMAYKDEYEVARLYTNGDFKKNIRETFEGNYKLNYHLAPPLIARLNKHTGIPKKLTFGSWVYPVFKLLAQLKGLRGTRLDIFSYTEERAKERGLIKRYNNTVDHLLSELNEDNLAYACQIASLPDQIRGYGHVKENSIQTVSKQWDSMLEGYCAGKNSYLKESYAKDNSVHIIDFPIMQLPG
jgi:indolepyruvate ferredoxin oxidoreductase